MASTDRPPPLTYGSLVDVVSPDRVRHVGRIVGVSASATTVAILVERVRESELRWNDARGRAVLAKSPTESLTMHFDTGTFRTEDEDASGVKRVLNHTVLAKSDGGSGLASGTWANAEGWKWTRAKVVEKPARLKAVRPTGPRPFGGDDFGGLDDHDREGGDA